MSAFNQDITEEESQGGFDPGEQGDETFLLDKIDEYPGVLPELDFIEASVIPAEPGTPSLIDDYEEIPEVVAEAEPEKLESDDSLDEIPEYEDDGIPDYVDDDDTTSTESNVDSSIDDADLKNLVQSELDRSKQFKDEQISSGKISTKKEYADDEIEPVQEYFQPIDNAADKIEISDIELDKPSTINVKKIKPFVPPVIKPESEQTKQTEKKKKGPFFSVKRVLTFSGIIAILFIVLIVIYFEDIVQKNKFDLELLDEYADLDTIEIKDIDKFIDSIQPRKPLILKPLETNKSDNSNVDSFATDYAIPAGLEELEDEPEILTLNTSKPKKSYKKPVVKTKSKKKTTNNSIKEAPLIKKKITKVDYKALSKTGTFIVQIISTPSYDDALDWLNKLEDRGINNGSISENLVRDKVYYRVRFGTFQTYDEASSALNKSGFDGAWVDRVK
ncbi:SPOR domain-containing protein [Candidatus Kapabacteria bacterium]|nr:SPOR domain-containing protein [Candidatus Kapabacteria bacterium]